MLTGKELGDALRVAIEKKAVTKKAVADYFGIKPPSLQDWINFGRIDKKHLNKLVAYFSDVVAPEHWGIDVDMLVTDREGRLTAVQLKSVVGTSPDDLAVSGDATLSVIEMSERLAAQIVAVARAGLLDQRGIALLEREMRRCIAATHPTTENSASGRLSDLEAPDRKAQHGRRGQGRGRPK
ncbi:hypothetical protein WT03_02325 [Burkholderia stagnalis]|nr:hypothetical protein WT03_02325 [Burkholderia stagnalis]KVM16670.1 hypothetical protein WT04_03075 [Burkholderia stagnalis]